MTTPATSTSRIILATTWRPAAMVAAFVSSVAAISPSNAELVFAVPREPAGQDADAARMVLRAAAPDLSCSVTVESFTEVLEKPYSVAFIPPADMGEAWEAFAVALREVADLRPDGARPGAGLHARLQTFREPQTSTAPAESMPTPAPTTPPRWATYLGDRTALVRMAWGGRVAVPTERVYLLGNILETGMFEPRFTRYLSRTITSGDVIVDVGANIGLHTTLMGSLVGGSGRVVAYEPYPDNLFCLRKSIAASGLIGLVDVREAACSDAATTLPLTVSRTCRGQGTLMYDKVEVLPGVVDPDSYRIDVPTVRLDEDLREVERIDFIKIDVEGAEERVLAGASGLLESGRVRRIALECYRHHLGTDWDAFARRLHHMGAHGWTFRILDDQGNDYEVPASTVTDHGHFETVIIEPARTA